VPDPARSQTSDLAHTYLLADANRMTVRGTTDHQPADRDWRAYRRISHVGTIPSVTTRDLHSRHRAVRDAATAQVAVTADQDAVRAAKVTAVLIKRCRTVLTEHCRYITK
jgi:hypothetical protein